MRLGVQILGETDRLHWCFYQTENGRKKPQEDLLKFALTYPRLTAKLYLVLERIEAGTTRSGDVKPISSGILEARASHSGVHIRLFYFTKAPHLVAVKFVVKKRNATDPDDIKYVRRIHNGWVSTDCSGEQRL